ncbi:rhomboid family intramembrane serine protease [Geothrix alkalitolerans]|uniref:rhomboid family intramembrane serine protease n=1 Tax=Geothrix alkalitolerans TaxID=2922724 RepID=UPI001FB034FE|nr:rhomboid family intramembrane serine protease [Geothrix alkalitolerans]
MDALALTAEALREPWRLWTGHLVHFGWEHALANAVALAVPWILAAPRDRRRLALATLILPPLLSVLLLPSLGGGEYRGASGLVCALWALVGLRLAVRNESALLGLMLLASLLVKLAAETVVGGGVLLRADGWSTLPAAHLWGSGLGLAAALPVQARIRLFRPRRT